MTAKSQATLQATLAQRGLAGMEPGEIDDLLDSVGDVATFQGLTAGTAVASKPVILGASKDIATITSATITTLTTGAVAAVDASLGVDGLAAAQGGAVVVTGGTSSTSGNAGGAVSLVGGTPGATGVGGAASLTAAAGGATSGKGGKASVTAGNGTAGDGAGGSVVVTAGAKNGSGLDGGVFLRGPMTFFKYPAAGAGTDQNETLTAATMINAIFVHTIATGRTLTTPTGAQISAGCPTDLAVGDSFLFHLITVGTGADDIVTLTAGASGVTLVGPATVGPDIQATEGLNAYGTWLFRNSAADTWIGYRIG